MTGLQLIRLIISNVKFIATTTIIIFCSVFIATMNEEKEYASHALLNTGLISGYNIESQGSSKVDYAYTNNEIENLINVATATETMVELSLSLLKHCINDSIENVLPQTNQIINDLKPSFQGGLNETEQIIEWKQQLQENKESELYGLVYSKHPLFGIRQLEQLKVFRQGNSDMIKLEYKSVDPRISQLTLELLAEIFIRKHREVKQGQTNSVVDFFELARNKSAQKLHEAENKLLNYSVENQIINYYEQTRFIAGNKQDLEKQYQEVRNKLAATDSVIIELETQLTAHRKIPQLQTSISSQMSQISEVASEITVMDLMITEVSPTSATRKANLKETLDSLKTSIASNSNEVMLASMGSKGVHINDVLRNWLQNVIERAQTIAELEVMRIHQEKFKQTYREFAPLGSTLKRLEREIDVAEREYLENLHSLNQAQLHKFNTIMSSNLKVIDPPLFPSESQKSKRILYLIISALTGIILSIGLIIGQELLDDSLKTPSRTAQLVNAQVMGTLPAISNRKAIDYEFIEYQAMNLWFQQLRIVSQEYKTPVKIGIESTEFGEGKTFLLQRLIDYSKKMNLNILVCCPNGSSIEGENIISYNADPNHLYNINGLNQIIEENHEVKDSNYDFVFIELPALIHYPYHPLLIKDIDIHVVVCNAQRSWTLSDNRSIEMFRQVATSEPQVFLNGVSSDVMEEIIGQIPKRRSWFRKRIKNLFIKTTVGVK